MALKTIFCAKCGKETAELVDNLCTDCFYTKSQIVVPKRFVLTVCNNCKVVRWRGIWMKGELDYFFSHSILEKISLPEEFEVEDIKILELGKKGKVEITLSLLNTDYVLTKDISLETRNAMCDECKETGMQKYAAKIQFRTKTDVERVKDKVLNYAQNYKKSLLKIEDQKEGIDLHFTNKVSAKRLAGELVKAFGCKMSETSEQYSWDNTKNRPKYRSVILLRR
jgi:nonsense-mediated mRNA decay protein 3